jgi:isopropylmalate/homocitrate/citramalate synthase
MKSAGARVLREDDNEMSREAVLLQWERKIEVADRLDAGERPEPEHPAASTRRFVRSPDALKAAREQREQAAREQVAAAAREEREDVAAEPIALAERRTITITGQPTPARRRRAVMDAQLAQPDRIALWAFLLGLLLVAVAAGTAHA